MAVAGGEAVGDDQAGEGVGKEEEDGEDDGEDAEEFAAGSRGRGRWW